MAIIGRFPGGRPLRRRREAVLLAATGDCEGPRALQASFDHRCHKRDVPLPIDSGGRPLRRRHETVR